MGPDFCLPERVKDTDVVDAVGVGVSGHSHAGVQNCRSVLQGTQKSLSEGHLHRDLKELLGGGGGKEVLGQEMIFQTKRTMWWGKEIRKQ